MCCSTILTEYTGIGRGRIDSFGVDRKGRKLEWMVGAFPGHWQIKCSTLVSWSNVMDFKGDRNNYPTSHVLWMLFCFHFSKKNINYFPLVYCLSKNNKIKLCNVAFQALTYLLECSFFGTRLGCCAGAHVGERNLPDVIFSWVSSQQSRSPSAYFLKGAILTISQPQLISPKAKTKQNTQALTLSWQELEQTVNVFQPPWLEWFIMQQKITKYRLFLHW